MVPGSVGASVNGGTGSGLGSLILENIAVDYRFEMNELFSK